MFGMGFTEIMIIAVIAILFLGPEKLPSAMVDIAKFFRSAKRTINSVKDSLEQEMNVSEIKQEALAYKKELLEASNEVKKATDMSDVSASLSNFGDDIMDQHYHDDNDDEQYIDENKDFHKKEKQEPKAQKITFEKKKKKEDNIDV
jgi:sec-independent protein translocase protein TatB